MQYTTIFHGCKNDNFQLNCFDYFHIFAQNIHCGYTLEPPHFDPSKVEIGLYIKVGCKGVLNTQTCYPDVYFRPDLPFTCYVMKVSDLWSI